MEWRQCWRLGCWGVETTLETWRLGSGDDVGDLADVEWSQRWRLDAWGVEMTFETRQLGSGDEDGDVVAGE